MTIGGLEIIDVYANGRCRCADNKLIDNTADIPMQHMPTFNLSFLQLSVYLLWNVKGQHLVFTVVY